MNKPKNWILILLLFILAVLGTSCQSDEQETIQIASKPMSEQYILAEMLALLIESDTDLAVETTLGVGGGTSNIHPAMESGDFDLYPEYTGTGWLFVLKNDLIEDGDEMYRQLKTAYEEEYALTWSGLYGFNNTFALAVSNELYEEYGIESYSDLASVSGLLDFGAEYDFYEREDGYPGLVETYGFDFANTVELDIGLKYEAIAGGEVDVINVFSTDGRLKEYDLKVLEDDLGFFPSYHAATVIRQDTLTNHPALEETIEKLTGQISNDEITQMNYLVEVENQDPKQVAEDFLREKGLLD